MYIMYIIHNSLFKMKILDIGFHISILILNTNISISINLVFFQNIIVFWQYIPYNIATAHFYTIFIYSVIYNYVYLTANFHIF